ncbi:MAG: septum site-determining protein MinC [Lachnospiraceae bacterium]|jgi:septum site-determining protein MinC|nr:septum site-determining protein MinC [Lachnospiraceae bacterium]MBR7000027.1 septum site-determining protein MinC [Lachnospiraceae bacterium]
MDNNVIIKGYKDGISLVLSPDASFEEILESLEKRIKSSAKFLGSARMSMKFEGRELDTDEQKEILRVISENSDLEIICVIDGNETNETILRQTMDQVIGSLSTKTAQFYQGIVRSGRRLETENSIIILGNVETGAEIVSGGNIIVIGALLGTAIAGTNSNREAFVYAAQMKPEKLMIGHYEYHAPVLTEKEKKKEAKLLKKSQLEFCSKIAEIVDEDVKIRPVVEDTFAADEELYELID